MLPRSLSIRPHVFIGLVLLLLGSALLLSMWLIPLVVSPLVGIVVNEMFRGMVHSFELQKYSAFMTGIFYVKTWGVWIAWMGMGVYLGVKRQWLLFAALILALLSSIIAESTISVFLFATFLTYHFSRKFWVAYGMYVLSYILFLAITLFQIGSGMAITTLLAKFFMAIGFIFVVVSIYKFAWLIRIKNS